MQHPSNMSAKATILVQFAIEEVLLNLIQC